MFGSKVARLRRGHIHLRHGWRAQLQRYCWDLRNHSHIHLRHGWRTKLLLGPSYSYCYWDPRYWDPRNHSLTYLYRKHPLHIAAIIQQASCIAWDRRRGEQVQHRGVFRGIFVPKQKRTLFNLGWVFRILRFLNSQSMHPPVHTHS